MELLIKHTLSISVSFGCYTFTLFDKELCILRNILIFNLLAMIIPCKWKSLCKTRFVSSFRNDCNEKLKTFTNEIECLGLINSRTIKWGSFILIEFQNFLFLLFDTEWYILNNTLIFDFLELIIPCKTKGLWKTCISLNKDGNKTFKTFINIYIKYFAFSADYKQKLSV